MKMTVSNIPNLIKAFIENDDQRAILIEGCWGCGKTFQIKKYINTIKSSPKNEALDVYYISLFGVNTTAEINTALYQLVHPEMNILEKGIDLISSALNPFPILSAGVDTVATISESIKGQTSKIKNKVVIFDDLERKGTGLHYADLLGYFNRLMDNGCKLVCVCSFELLH